MNEYRCGECGWGAVARTVEGMLAASAHHAKSGCGLTAGQGGENDE